MSEHKTPLTDLVKREIIWAWMTSHNVNRISVEFSGSGDDGHIDNVVPVVGPLAMWGSPEYEAHEAAYKLILDAFHAEMVTLDPAEPPVKFSQMIEDMSNDILNSRDSEGNEIPDWYNNDGGNGTLDWTLIETDDQVLDDDEPDAPKRTKFVFVTVHQAEITYNTTHHVF